MFVSSIQFFSTFFFKKKLTIIYCLLASTFLSAQKEPLSARSEHFDEKKWNEIVNGLNYNEEKRDRNPYEIQQKRFNIQDKFKEPPKPKELPFSPNFEMSSAILSVLKFLGIVLGVGFIAFLIYLFVTGRVKDKKVVLDDFETELKNIEDNLPEADIDTPLDRAIKEGKYTLALRLYYLLILQDLINNGKIKWRKDKTNRSYISELRQQAFLPQFMTATLLYEKAWFGKVHLDKNTFESQKEVFDQLKKAI